MADFGYDKSRFINLTTDNFDCPICSEVAKNPKDCSNCGALFCGPCIDEWIAKKLECPNRCPKDAKIDPIQRALKKIYQDLELKCEFCEKVCKIGDIDKHQSICKLPKCINFDICGNQVGEEAELKDMKVCDSACSLLAKVRTSNTKDQIYHHIKQFVKDKVMVQPSPQQSFVQGGSGVVQTFKWDKNRAGQGIQLSDNDCHLFLKEQAYMFRTAIADTGFSGGIIYWELLADERTENELKIGVATKRDFNYNTAFCDYEFGYSYYGLGQLRHNSNATGPSYGKRFKKEGVLGICLNMNKGTLSFSLNGELMGVAYNDPNLKKGPIFPAVSLLHCAGCKLITGKPVPQIFNNC